MIQVVSSFSTEPSLDVVVSSIPAQIFEAVRLLKENVETVSAKVSLIEHFFLNTMPSVTHYIQYVCKCNQACLVSISCLNGQIMFGLKYIFPRAAVK